MEGPSLRRDPTVHVCVHPSYPLRKSTRDVSGPVREGPVRWSSEVFSTSVSRSDSEPPVKVPLRFRHLSSTKDPPVTTLLPRVTPSLPSATCPRPVHVSPQDHCHLHHRSTPSLSPNTRKRPLFDRCLTDWDLRLHSRTPRLPTPLLPCPGRGRSGTLQVLW